MAALIAICIPSLDFVSAGFACTLAVMARQTREPVGFFNVTGAMLPMARDKCIDAVEETEREIGKRYDYVFFLDSDVLAPPTTISRLIAHNKDVVGATYARRGTDKLISYGDLPPPTAPNPEGLVEVEGLPTGCLLVRREIFDRLPRPYFRFVVDETTGTTYSEDYAFCRAVRALQYQVWLDLKLTAEIGHVGLHVFRPQTSRAAGQPATT